MPFDEPPADEHPDHLAMRRLIGDLRRQLTRVERERDDALIENRRLRELAGRRWWQRKDPT